MAGCAAEHATDAGDALAIGAVLRDEHVSRARHERADRGFDGKGTAALQRHAFVGPGRVHDVEQAFAHPAGDPVEIGVPGAPVAQHALLRRRRDRQRAGGQ